MNRINVPKSEYQLYCDGACRGNPGPAAIGAILYDPEGKILFEISKRIGQATNNEAEYRALIAGIEQSLDTMPPEATLHIHLDSQLVVRQVLGHYKVKNARMKPLYNEVRALLTRLSNWRIKHVPRDENAVADALANQAYQG